MFNFSLYFLFINIFAKARITNAQFNHFYQYMLFLTKVKQFSNLLDIKKKQMLLFQLRYAYIICQWFPWKQNPVPKISRTTTSDSNFSISHGKLTQIAEK